MYIVPRWDYLCIDSWWLFYALSWMTDGRQAKQGETVHVRLSQRRPNMCEILDMTPDRTALYTVLDRSEPVAQLRTSQASASKSIQSQSEKKADDEETFVVRFSDLSVIKDCPYGFLYRSMDDGIMRNRAPLEALDLTVFVSDVGSVLTEGTAFKVEVLYLDENTIHCSLLVKDLLVADMRLTLFKVSAESRYDNARTLVNSTWATQLAMRTIHAIGEDVVTSLPVSLFETSGPAAMATGLLHFADVASSVAWDHCLPPSSVFWTAQAEDGKRMYIVMYRGVVTEVFSWPRAGSTLFATSWLARTGTSTFDLRVDFRDGENIPVATVQVTLVVVNRIKMRSNPVFHDKKWGEERYRASIEKCLPADISTPEALKNPPKEVFEYSLGKLRHSDHDQNGHVNSAKYLDLVHDAREAALKAGFFPDKVKRVVERDGWIKRYGIDYILELRLDSAKDPVIRLSYQVTEEKGDSLKVLTLFEIADGSKLCTRAWVESRSDFDSKQAQPLTPLEFPGKGCVPEHWGIPSSFLQQSNL